MLTREKREELLDSMPAVVLHGQTPVLGYDCGLQVAANVIECGGDGRGEQAERHDNCDRDHCQDDAVLSHRLTLLDGVACAEVMDQILERHGFTPLRKFGRALARSAKRMSGCGIDSNAGKTACQTGASFLSKARRFAFGESRRVHRLAAAKRVSPTRVIAATFPYVRELA